MSEERPLILSAVARSWVVVVVHLAVVVVSGSVARELLAAECGAWQRAGRSLRDTRDQRSAPMDEKSARKLRLKLAVVRRTDR